MENRSQSRFNLWLGFFQQTNIPKPAEERAKRRQEIPNGFMKADALRR